MSSKEALLRYFKVYTDEIARCEQLQAKCYWSLLHLVLAIPDICSSLEKGKADGDFYQEWCDEFLSRTDARLTKKDWWLIRNAVFHRGTSIARKSQRFSFGQPDARRSSDHKKKDADGVMYLDVSQLASEMKVAMESWLERVASSSDLTMVVEQRMQDLVWEGPTTRLVYMSNPASIPNNPKVSLGPTGGVTTTPNPPPNLKQP